MASEQDFPHLTKAPITEALIDIQVAHKEAPSMEVLRGVVDVIKDDFPVIEERFLASLQVEFKDKEAKAGRKQAPHGFNAKSEDGKYVIQVLVGRLSVNRLAPYISWDDLREKTERIWGIYLEKVKPARVTRLATRYINRIVLPNKPFELSNLLRKPVELPEGLPEGVGSYLVRLAIPDTETGSVAYVHQVLEPATPERSSHFIFDIDVFMGMDLDPHSEEVWETLEGLRGYKNRIFFRCLTEQVVESFK